MTNEKIVYRGEEIEIVGRGYYYKGLLWPMLRSVHAFIDNILDGTKKDVLFDNDYFGEKPIPPKIKYNPNE